jgi:hypothetical protein
MSIFSAPIKTREIRNGEDQSRLVINLDFLPLFEEAGLTAFADLFHCPGGELIKRIPDRTVTRISPAPGHLLYLKRHLLEGPQPWWMAPFTKKPASEGAIEFANYCLFRGHGLATALPVAMGERVAAGSNWTESFLITQEFTPLISLEDIIRSTTHLLAGPENMDRRRRILFAAADYARRMHGSGLNHLDYNATHILVPGLDGTDQPLPIAVFDLQRVARNRLSSWRWPIKTLAELNYTLPAELFSEDERLFLLKSYLGKGELTGFDRLLWRAICAKTAKIGRHTIKRRARRQRERARGNGREQQGPRHLLIHDQQRGTVEPVTAEALLREVPGSREVWTGRWQGQPVIVKSFRAQRRGRRQLALERQGLLTLRDRGIAAPLPLLHGEDAMGRPVLVMGRIEGAVSATEVLAMATRRTGPDGSEARQLLTRALARLNHQGVEQKDLHTGNFLFQGGKVFTIDPAEMRFVRGSLGLKRSLSQLAQMGALFPELDAEEFKQLILTYARTRHWHLSADTMARLEGERQRLIAVKLNNRLKKYGRRNTRHEEVIGTRYRLLIDRQTGWQCREPEELAAVLREAFIGQAGTQTGQPVGFTWEGRQLAAYRVNEATGVTCLLKAVLANSRRTSELWQDLYRKQAVSGDGVTPVALLQPRSLCPGLATFIVIDPVPDAL